MLIPVPVVKIPPGLRINVHIPLDGNPLKNTFPVNTVHVGWVIVPTIGTDGVAGCALITTLADDKEVHPAALVTV